MLYLLAAHIAVFLFQLEATAILAIYIETILFLEKLGTLALSSLLTLIAGAIGPKRIPDNTLFGGAERVCALFTLEPRGGGGLPKTHPSANGQSPSSWPHEGVHLVANLGS